jgi:asparagine synthase (glutamine-hydrolysing)
MCGISGVFGAGEVATVREMLATLVHRGPDDEHFESGHDFAIGARRLSILDLDHGRQPMTDESGQVWAALNGELYNYPTLRAELAARGHRLATRCDTEVLAHLYQECGSSLVKAIDGMFAVAVWDDAQKVGVLARDRMGKKPIYYLRRNGALYFASEIKALLRVPGFARQVDLEALHHFLSFKHVPSPLSIFSGIRALPPAHTLVFRPGAEPVISRYWSPDFTPDKEVSAMSEEEIVEEIVRVLRKGVTKRLLSDVPVGFLLSGGIDSSLSTALAAESATTTIKTFCLTYADDSTTAGKDEDRTWARWVAERYRTEHHEESVRFKDFPEELRRILACFDEPFAGVMSTYLLSRLIGRYVKVAIAGDGADELFGSYRSHRLAMPIANYPKYEATGDPTLLRPFQDEPDTVKALVGEEWRWRSTMFTLSEAEKAALYTPAILSATRRFSSPDLLHVEAARLTARDPVNRILELEFRTIFPDQVLTFVDRLSMAHSLELRSGYLDTALVEFVARIPGAMKLRDGETKYLLKKAALRFFPREMVYRKKEGFLMPITTWLAGDLRGYVEETLNETRLRKHGFFRPEAVATLIADAYAAPSNYLRMNKVFSLLVFQEWYDLYFA